MTPTDSIRSSLVRRTLVAICLSLALVCAGSTATALAHSGPATPANSWEGGHWWSSDGCTASPDWPFLHACIHHDGCYRYHWASRATCDSWFYNDMTATCQVIGGGWSCYLARNIYYGAVRAGGAWAYNGYSIYFALPRISL
jgi:Prokaryotic phospholipase A2